jgi:type IV pilus assembly protein PilX
MTTRAPVQTRHLHQQGIALIVVMVMLLLASIVVLSSMRLGWLNERMVGSESDQQRAFAAAEALIRDAERDIKGVQADATTPCQTDPAFVGCRNFAAGAPFFPQDLADLELLKARLAASTSSCLRGICLPQSVTTLGREQWTTKLGTMTAGSGDSAVPARYGEFTGIDPAASGNALLQWSRPGVTPVVPARAWYWVEVFLYTEAAAMDAASAHALAPDMHSHPFVYRITAYVQGMKPGTRVWLRSIFVPRPQSDLN